MLGSSLNLASSCQIWPLEVSRPLKLPDEALRAKTLDITDAAVLAELGERLSRLRLQRNRYLGATHSQCGRLQSHPDPHRERRSEPVVSKMTEVAVPRSLFWRILARIRRLRPDNVASG